MGTLCQITAFQVPGSGDPAEAIDAAFAELKRIDGLLSNWNPDSALMRMNRAAGVAGSPRPWVTVGAELFERLHVALQIARDTDGIFDPTVGPLVRAWGFLPRCLTADPCPPFPRTQAIEVARQRIGWNHIRLDTAHTRVQFELSNLEIDLGGIAKGYAAERAAAVLRQRGIRSALVNLGNSSIKAIGEPPPETSDGPSDGHNRRYEGWRVSVLDPRDGRSVAGTICLMDGEALGTSGTYEHAVGVGKNKRAHIIDPYTGQALAGDISVTVRITDAETADALTKPFMLRPDLTSQLGRRILARDPRANVIVTMVHNGKLVKRTAGSVTEDRVLRD